MALFKRSLSLNLPFPPSANHYWRMARGRMIVSKVATYYKSEIRDILEAIDHKILESRLIVKIIAYPPDKRRRDLDNMLKVILDALRWAGIYIDDSQIDELYISRGKSIPPGHMDILIEEI